MTSAATPPGWYPDPHAPGYFRWFDGSAWTAHVHPAGYLHPPAYSNAHLKWVLPVNRSGLAIAAGYAGLFAITLILAPIALVLGVLALVDLARRPEIGGSGRAWFGFVTGLFGTVLLVGAATGWL